MKTLLVTPFAPYRDGIATYAVQELRRLRADGESVEVLSPLPSAARWHLKLGGPAGMVQLGRKVGGYDRTVMQFGPELLFGQCRSAGQRVAVWTALAAIAARTSLDIRIHEIEYGPLEQNPLERRAARLALGQADRVTVHTEAERAGLDKLLGLGRRVEVIEHGRDFAPAVTLSTEEARAELGLVPDGYCFVAIGFLQHHKGFDRAIDAMAMVAPTGMHLHVVGSARVDHPDILGYIDDLRRRCEDLDNVTLHERFVSDVEFDIWLQAADTVVLPYREIWSSGVLERARLLGRQILAADLAPLRDQAPPGAVFATEVDELAVAMEALAVSSGNSAVRFSDGTGTGHRTDPSAVSGPNLGGAVRDRTAPWEIDRRAPDRARIEEQIVARARSAELQRSADRPVTANRTGGRSPIDPLLALGPLHRPQPNSARPGVAPLKRAIDRLIGWQIDPLASRIEDLQRATVEAMSSLDTGQNSDAHDQVTPEAGAQRPVDRADSQPSVDGADSQPSVDGADSQLTTDADYEPMLDLAHSEKATVRRSTP